MKGALGSGASEEDYIAVLNNAAKRRDLLEAAHEAFLNVTDGLEEKIIERFGRSVDAAVVFYLGLCNGAGWVTEYRGRTAILLGMEKIAELNWCSVGDMRGLICHELGHVYQKQYGVLNRQFCSSSDAFLWQLFTEGVAMCFEQEIVGDREFYHQDKGGWKAWCDGHFEEIKADLAADLSNMTPSNQRYFGDWVSYHGHGDVGYYLGCRFVRFALADYDFDEIISFGIDEVKELFQRFLNEAPRQHHENN